MKKSASGVLIVSLDFELFWGLHDYTTLEKYGNRIQGGRKSIPNVLEIFRKYGIHATWATVGFQFADRYEELLKYSPSERDRPAYDDIRLSSYQCFDIVGKDEADAPCFFAPSLIKLISEYEGQEIGSHTFSHYYCREQGQTTQQFRSDMKAAVEIARAKGYQLTSVVFPKNQSTQEHLNVLREMGFTAYRDEEKDWIHEKVKFRPLKRLLRLMDVYIPLTGQGGYIPQNENGMVNLVGSRMYKPFFKPLSFLEDLKIKRIKQQMLYAAKNGLTFHLWWHPHNIGIMRKYHLQRLEEIFSYFAELKKMYGMRSLNMREAAEEVLNR